MINIKRIYEPAQNSDGARILVDRLWPRGISKERAKLDLWLKEIAPSTELRVWYEHDPQKWPIFKARYLEELRRNKTAIDKIKKVSALKNTTLLYAAKDQEHNEAKVLQEFLAKK